VNCGWPVNAFWCVESLLTASNMKRVGVGNFLFGEAVFAVLAMGLDREIDEHCAKQWETDFQMRAYCITKKAKEAMTNLSRLMGDNTR
jgi:hypothetical protein